jgi:hypothetical protein
MFPAFPHPAPLCSATLSRKRERGSRTPTISIDRRGDLGYIGAALCSIAAMPI